MAKDAGWDATLGPLDPELGRKTAGVGFISQQGMMPLPIKAETKDYDDAVKTGRLLIQQWELQTSMLQVATTY